MRFRILAEAQQEAQSAADWYGNQRAELEEEFIGELDRAYSRLRSTPQSCSLVENYFGEQEIRWLSLRRFSYLVFFQLHADELIVIAVQHVKQQPLYWIDRLQ